MDNQILLKYKNKEIKININLRLLIKINYLHKLKEIVLFKIKVLNKSVT